MYDRKAQSMEALAWANQIRSARRDLKNALTEGETTLKQVFDFAGEELGTMRVRELLLAVPALGPVKADQAMSRCELPSTVTVERLSRTRRNELVQMIHDTYPAVVVSGTGRR